MATIRVLVISPDGTGEIKRVGRDLNSLTAEIGGHLEEGTLDQCVFYCDEEGKLKGLPINVRATRLARALGWRAVDDVLCGPVMFVGAAGPDDDDLPDAVIELHARL